MPVTVCKFESCSGHGKKIKDKRKKTKVRQFRRVTFEDLKAEIYHFYLFTFVFCLETAQMVKLVDTPA